jgi:hypothetical protein
MIKFTEENERKWVVEKSKARLPVWRVWFPFAAWCRYFNTYPEALAFLRDQMRQVQE